MTIVPRLTTVAACRVARIDRGRFNEYVASGDYTCAPNTIPGRARLFTPDDMLALVLFKRLIDDGFTPKRAGSIACAIGEVAKHNPEARAVSYVESYFTGAGDAFPASAVPTPETWDDVIFGGTDIRKVTTFRVGKERDMIAHYTEEERQIIGEED